MVVQFCRVLMITALAVAPLSALAADNPATQAVQQEMTEQDEEPACTSPTAKTVGEAAQVQEIGSVCNIQTLTETQILTEVVTITQTVFLTEVVTIEQIVPVTQTVVVTEIVPVEQIVPVTQTVFVTEVVTIEQIVPVTQTVVVTEVVTIEQIVPVTQTVVVTEVIPVEQIVPVTQTVVVTEVVPMEQTLSAGENEGTTQTPATSADSTGQTPDSAGPQASGQLESSNLTAGAASGIHSPATDRPANSQSSVPSKPVTNWLQLSPPYSEPTPLPITGLAMYYAPQVMDRVELYRERVNQIEACEECIGRVALLRAGDLGRLVWIQVGDGIVEGPFQVLDVAARHHIPDLLRRNWVVDVDYETARRWGMRGPIEVTVFAEPPEKLALRMSEHAQQTTP
uniref:Uncharacterized protein n=1 Tax=Caldilinea aerophila TaxID=133453 RepID=A0A7C1K0Z8_9CHLR